MDQPTGEQALKELEPLIGEWTLEAIPPGAEPWPGEARATNSDDRGVCRVYEMSIGNGEWKLWRQGEPFAQRFSATFEDDGNTIRGRWETGLESGEYETDFELIYRRA